MRVYIAHRMSGPEGSYLANCAVMCRAARALYEAGHDPYNPAADLTVGLVSGTPLDVRTYKRVGLAWLRVSDVMLAIGDCSQGVLDEALLCRRYEIPVLWVRDLDHCPYLYAVELAHYRAEFVDVGRGLRDPWIDATGAETPPWETVV